MEVSYTIQMAAKISGVGVHTIRAWEKRYKAVVPRRDGTGHRVYSKEDIEKLILLSELCILGYSISKIANQNSEELKEQLKALGKSEDSIKSLEMNLVETQVHEEVDYSQSLSIILLALKTYKLDIVAKEIGKLKMLLNSREFALKIVLPVMTELNQALVRGEYTISHEHALSSIMKFHIGHLLYKSQENRDREYLTIIFCGIEQDYHEFGILMGSLLAQYYQFNVIYLGANLPADSLIDASKFLDAKLIVVGATSIVSLLGKNYLSNYVEKVANGVDDKIDLIIGTDLDFEINPIFKRKVKHIKSLDEFDRYLATLL